MLKEIFILCLISFKVFSLPLDTATYRTGYNANLFHNLSTSSKLAHDSLIAFMGDTGKQSEEALFISTDFLPNPSRIISAVNDKKGRLKLSSWLVKEDGSIIKRGDNGISNDNVRMVHLISHNGHILTPIRRKDDYKGFLISWYLHRSKDADSIVEVDRVSIFDGQLAYLRIEAVFSNMYVTSFLEDTKRILYLVSWRINPDGSINKLATVSSGIEADGISVLHLQHPYTAYVVTTLTDKRGKMKLLLWHVNYINGAITMAGSSSSTVAPLATNTHVVTIGGRIYTSYVSPDNELKVMGWKIDQSTLNIVPAGETGERSGIIEQHGLVSFHDLQGRNRLVSGFRSGSDKVVLVDWIVKKDLQIMKNNELVLSRYSPHPKFGRYDLHVISHPFAQLVLAFRDKSNKLKLATWGVF